MITDDYVINLFYGKRQLIHKYIKKFLNNDSLYFDKELYDYIINRYDDCHDIKESLFRIKNHIEEVPKCPICGKPNNFQGNKYTKHCSKKCTQQDNNVRIKRYNTSIILYGSGCNYKKYKETCKQKYGVENVFCLTEKIKESYIKKYGVDNPQKVKQIKEKTINTCKTTEIRQKRYDTMKRNHTFNSSKQENECLVILKNIFPDVHTQYKDERYPFNCDFYIPSLDLFIECNFHWTHGGHPYNEDLDKDKLELWKSKNTKFYENAITTWTIRDPKKRKTAKENKLNFIEFWNLNDVKEWLNTLS